MGVTSIKVANTANNPDEFWHYGLAWKPATQEDFVRPAPGYYMLDVLHYVQEQKKDDSWFKNRKPDYRIGSTIYIFKVSNP